MSLDEMPDAAPQPRPQPQQQQQQAAPRRAAKPRSKAMQGIALSLGFVAAVMLVLAGVPSAGRTPMPRVATLPSRSVLDLSRSGELAAGFAELSVPVDATGQRPDYPTTDELATRLEQLPGWQSAALFALDATPAELFAAGVTDPEVAMTLASAPMPEAVPALRHWKLALVDEHGRIVATTLFELPAPEVEHLAMGDGQTSGPTLERRFPDWPRAQVFKRAGGGARSDG